MMGMILNDWNDGVVVGGIVGSFVPSPLMLKGEFKGFRCVVV